MPLRLPLLVCMLIAAISMSVGFDALSQTTAHSHRLKKLFDFEDSDERGNKIGHSGKLLPRNWYVIGRKAIGENDKFSAVPLHASLEARAGYPQFSPVGFDKTRKATGDFSLRLGLTGGNTGAFVQHGAVHVKPQSDYRVTAKVLTHKLDHAWAELHAYFLDQFGHRVPGSVRISDPIQTDGAWQSVSVKLPGDFNEVAYLGIELHVVQPGRDSEDPIGDHQVVPADIDGGAWFDDVAVWELPSVSITTGVRTNIIPSTQKPKLRARVRDLTGTRLRAQVDIYNHRYEHVDGFEDDINDEGWSWTPDLNEQYGWYWADLKIFETDSRGSKRLEVARTLTGFLWLAPGRPGGSEDRSRFTLVAEDVPTEHLPLIEEMMQQTGLNSLVVSGWERGGTAASTVERARVLEPIVRDLLVKRGHVAVSFWPVPVELAARAGIDAYDPLNLLTKPADEWMDYAKPFLSPLGQRLSNWQVGSTNRPNAFLALRLADDMEAARHGIRTTAPSPRLIAPWRLDQPYRGGELPGTDRYAIGWPQGFTHHRLAEALEGWPTPPSTVRLDIELADAEDQTHERRVADLMLRTLHAWEVQAGSVALPKPWTEAHDRRLAFIPDPAFGVFINLARHLEGQRVIGRMPLGPGLQAMILDGEQGGMLAVWNEKADEDPADLSLYLGESPVMVDPFGNTRALKAVKGKHRFTVGRTPTIIRGIDARLAQMRAGFSLDQPFIQSLQIAHRRVLRIKNPWPRTLNGIYSVTGPEGWNIQPQRKQISIAPGDTAEIPIAMRFPIHEDGGHKTLTADFVFDVGQDYMVTLSAPMEVGLEGVEFDATVIVEPGKEPGTTDAIVTLVITNTADARQSLNIFAGLFGHARREMILPGVGPGEFVSRRVRFKDVGDQIGKHPLRCGVREAKGPAVLNKSLELIRPREAPEPPPPVAEADAP